MHARIRITLAVVFTLTVVTVAPFAQQTKKNDPPKEFTAKVVGVTDGDTICVLVDQTKHTVRLTGLDAPASGVQPFGTQATKALTAKLFAKDVKVRWNQRDRYGRILGDVYVGERYMSLEMLQEGLAWYSDRYGMDETLAKAQKEAKGAHRGLWVDDTAVAPSAWRKSRGLDPEKEDPTNPTVYLAKTGTKYHSAGCKHLSASSIPIPLRHATGIEPCSVCKPPTLKDIQSDKQEQKKDEKK